MAINLGSSPIAEIKLGSTPVQKALLGTTLVWPFLTTLSGIPPIIILNALERYVYSLTQTGKCEQSSTPTPSAPVNIYCNNGTLKAKHQSGLPIGYTLLDYVSNAASTRIRTSIYDDVDDFRIEMRIRPSAGSWYICQSRENPAAQIYGLSGATVGSKISFSAGGLASAISEISRNTTHIYTVIGEHKNGTVRLYVKDETTGDEDTQTGTYSTESFVAAPTPIGVWGTTANTVNEDNDIYYLRIYKGGALVADYLPCQYNGENGFYDRVTETIRTATAGTINAGTAVTDPVTVIADGTPETLTVCGKNIFDQSWFDTNVGATITYKTYGVPNGTYTMSTNMPLVNGTVANVFVKEGTTINPSSTNNGVSATTPRTFTVSNGYYTVGYRTRNGANPPAGSDPKDYNWQVELGGAATTYEAYTAQTATVETLLSVPDYEDTQDIISGLVTRKVGTIILDGTEGWVNYSGGNGIFYFDGTASWGLPSNCLCTHYKGVPSTTGATAMPTNSIKCGFNVDERYIHRVYLKATSTTLLEELTTFLATQYANGTPVILLYPLATETTESVTAQPIMAHAGSNTISISPANVSDINLEVKYWTS